MEKYTAIKERAANYKDMLQQVENYRKEWDKSLKQFIIKNLEDISKAVEIEPEIEVDDKIHGLEVIYMRLGKRKTGIHQHISGDEKQSLFKDFGTLVYHQLFNGKVQVTLYFPLLEGVMEPGQPKLIGIFAPPEFEEDLILSNYDIFLKELIQWEDYDDDPPSGNTKSNAIGFNS